MSEPTVVGLAKPFRLVLYHTLDRRQFPDEPFTLGWLAAGFHCPEGTARWTHSRRVNKIFLIGTLPRGS